MDSPIVIPEAQRHRPTSVRRRVSLDSNSPEFEFWMVRNPSFPQPNIHSADELFVDGVLLPLHLLSAAAHPGEGDPYPRPEPDPDDSEKARPDTGPELGPGPKITSSSAVSSLSPSKRWRDIFKKSDKEKKNVKSERDDKDKDKDKDKEKKKERKSGTGSASSAELNINIWPFSRSRSAGNACTRPKPVFGGPARKANSAPCSRSNSAGESKSRKWPGSPARPGVHLGRSSPVWKVRRNSGGKAMESLVRNAEKTVPRREPPEIHRIKPPMAAVTSGDGGAAAAGKTKVLNLNVPMCMGYRNQFSCRSDENSALGAGTSVVSGGKSRQGSGVAGGSGGRGGGNVGSVGGGGNLFNFRSLFTKKVY